MLLIHSRARSESPAARVAPLALLALIVTQPAGLELTGSWLGWPAHAGWTAYWDPPPGQEDALRAELDPASSGRAGAVVLEELAGGPFRYVGYGGVAHPGSYAERRFEAVIRDLMVNGRPVIVGVYGIQGYNPIQLSRYSELILAVNGLSQDYHNLYLQTAGTDSSLLDLLSVRYAIVDMALRPDRADVLGLIEQRELVLTTPRVRVYRSSAPPPFAWIVHEVREVKRGEALPLIVAGEADPYRVALVEGDPPDVALPAEDDVESVTVLRYDPETIEIAVETGAPGLLIVSEIYAAGWRATVDDEPAEVLPAHHALRGIPLPAGAHTVTLHYDPPGLTWGLRVSIAAIGVLIALGVWRGWTRLRQARNQAAQPAG
jgi:hypothetical protein